MTHSAVAGLSKLENASLTAELTKSLHSWTYDEKNPALGSFGARTIGFIATPLTSLIDTIVHAFLFVGTATTGLFISSYNFIARHIDTKYLAPEDLELSASLIHLSRLIESLFNAAILPFVMLLDPERGYQLSQECAGGNFAAILEKYTATVAKLDQKKAALKGLEDELAAQKTEKHQQKKLIAELQLEIQDLKDQAQKYQDQYKEALLKGENTAAELSKSLAAQTQAKDALALKLAKLEDELKTKQKELEDALLGKVNDASLIADKAGLQAEVAALKEQLAAAQEKIAKETAALEAKKAVLDKAVAAHAEALAKSQEASGKEIAALKKEEAALQAKVKELTGLHEKVTFELNGVTEAAHQFALDSESAIDALKKEIGALQGKVKELTGLQEEKIAELKAVSEKAQASASSDAAQIATLKEKEATLTGTLDGLTVQLESVKEQLKAAKSALTDEQAAKSAAEKQHQAAVAALDSQVKALEKELAAANEKVQKATEKKAEAKAKVEADTKLAITQLEEELEASENELKALKAAFDKLQTESDQKSKQLAKTAEEHALATQNVEKLLGAIGKLKAEKQEAMDQFSAIDAKFNELKLEQESWLEAKAKLEGEIAGLKQEIGFKEEAIKGNSEQRKLLLKSLQEAKEALEGVVDDNGKLKEAYEQLQKFHDEATAEHELSKQELAKLKAQLEVKQEEMEALEERAEELVVANEALEGQLEAAQMTIASLEEKVAAAAKADQPKVAASTAADLVPVEEETLVAVTHAPSDSGEVKPLSPQREGKLAEIAFVPGEDPASQSDWNAFLQGTDYKNQAGFKAAQEKLEQWISNEANSLNNKKFKTAFAALRKVIQDYAAQ